MGLGVLMVSGFFGFIAAVGSGLVLGLSWLESLGVYSVAGLTVALLIFTVRGLYCQAAKKLA